MSWQETVDMAVWEIEPEPGLESRFTRGASDEWHSWNEWGVEREVAEFCGELVRTLKPHYLIETGVSQGFVTRRIEKATNMKELGHYCEIRLFEADDIIRSKIPRSHTLSPNPMPDESEIGAADLLLLDSHWPERINELKMWSEHGKPGSYAFLHDVKKDAAPGTGHRMMADLVSQLNLPTFWFDNPRGSVLVYKPYEWKAPKVMWPRVASRNKAVGSVMVAQMDPGDTAGSYSHSISRMMLHSGSIHNGGIIYDHVRKLGGPRVYAHRDSLVRTFLQTDADWLLQIDSDMSFPANLLDEMLAVADVEERPIIGGHCYMWRGESGPLPTMWGQIPGGSDADMVLIENYPKGGLVKVGATGGACTLIHRRVFEAIQASDPDYPLPWYEEGFNGDDPVGEDVMFCVRARRAGFDIYVHTGLDIGHEKLMTMNHEFFADWRRSRQFVITGLPRSGTGYMAKILQVGGVACLHEGVYTPDGQNWGTRWGDSSWLAGPHIRDFWGPTIQVVRHPFDTFSSLIAIEFFNPDAENAEHMKPFRDYAEKYVPSYSATWQHYTAYFMQCWYETIRRGHPDLTLKVEEIDVEKYQLLIAIARPPLRTGPKALQNHLDSVPTNWNTPEDSPHRLSVKEIHDLCGDDLTNWMIGLCEEWGYDPV